MSQRSAPTRGGLGAQKESPRERRLGLTAIIRACPLKPDADLMAGMFVTRDDGKDELWWRVFKHLFFSDRSRPRLDKVHRGMLTHTRRTQSLKLKGPHGWIHIAQTERMECSVHTERLACCWSLLNISSYFMLSLEKKQ